MSNLKYKEYIGSVEYSQEDECLFGKVLGLSKTLISYQGNTIQELKADFIDGIEQYLEHCKNRQTTPEKSFTGTFNVRIGFETHGKAVLKAKE